MNIKNNCMLNKDYLRGAVMLNNTLTVPHAGLFLLHTLNLSSNINNGYDNILYKHRYGNSIASFCVFMLGMIRGVHQRNIAGL